MHLLIILYILQSLLECKNELVNKLGIAPELVALSMGMSHDFETAVSLFFSNYISFEYVNKSINF